MPESKTMFCGKYLFDMMAVNQQPPRVPFVPTIYEHAARVIGIKPSEAAQDENLIVEGQLTCYECYKHDLVSVGLDIYNVECEAMGAVVDYPANDELPRIKQPLLSSEADFDSLRLPDPEKDGRMPLFINAAKRINRKIGHEVPVNGVITGPFTLAALLRGFEPFIFDLILEPAFASRLLRFTSQVCLIYADAYIRQGVGLSINESWIVPPLLSPRLYQELVFPVQKKLISAIKRKGQNHVALICGGNTTEIARTIADTGTSLLMADYNADIDLCKEICQKKNIMLRASVDAKLLVTGNMKELCNRIKAVYVTCSDYSKFILGCGVVGYDVKPETIIGINNLLHDMKR